MIPQLSVLRSWLNGIRLILYLAIPPIVPKLLHYPNNQAPPLKKSPKQSLENKKKKQKRTTNECKYRRQKVVGFDGPGI